MRAYNISVTYYKPKQGESSGSAQGNIFKAIRLIIKYASRARIEVWL